MSDSNLPMGAENDPRAPYNEVDLGTKECPTCRGEKYWVYSCCGDDIKGNDIDLCPTCYEHCGEGDREDCEECNATGEVPKTQEDINEEKEEKEEGYADDYESARSSAEESTQEDINDERYAEDCEARDEVDREINRPSPSQIDRDLGSKEK